MNLETGINDMRFCCSACPNSGSDEHTNLENLGCLPSYWEVQSMLKNDVVWACHNNINKPCSATGLDTLPNGMKLKTEY